MHGQNRVMRDYRVEVTARLDLTAVTETDLDDLHALSADPRVWEHFPSGRHLNLDATVRQLGMFRDSWDEVGLGYWTARRRQTGEFVGVGGCALRQGPAWNVYYRIRPEAQGHGYASELVGAGLKAARDARPDLAITAFLLEHNVASRRTAERAGLQLAWRGPDVGNPDPGAVRLVYADRPLTEEQITAMTAYPVNRVVQR
jgi:RimJ/RimL family protein N-acetyltransferase